MSDRRAVWNIVAVVATLGLSVVVAVVAVTRSEPNASPAPSPSVSLSPTPSDTPGGLNGDGPYVVYATGDGVFAYDVDSGSTSPLGPLDGPPITERSRQPGAGRVVAFPTQDGSVWSVTRQGMERVGAIPPTEGDQFEGAVLSPDDRKLAVGALAPERQTVIVNLDTGRSTAIPRGSRGQYPSDALLPVAWSLGGTVLYQIPYCECDGTTLGLYTLDTGKGTSAVLTGTKTTRFYRFAVSTAAQSLFYGTATQRRCRSGEPGPCEGPPYSLRRIAAGRRGPEVIKRATDAAYIPSGISQDGHLVLVQRIAPNTGASRVELYSDEGKLEPGLRGIPKSAEPLALLPRDVVLAAIPGADLSLVVVRAGRAHTLAKRGSTDEAAPVYLGWLL